MIRLVLRPALVLSVLWFPLASNAASLQQECDGEIKTCCFAKGFSNVPPMWITESSCPGGMEDDSQCPIQYGCKKITAPKP